MRQDGPTVPSPDWNDPDYAPHAPAEPYLSHPAPVWPDARARREIMTESMRAPRGYVSSTLFGMSVGANVALLITLIGVLMLSYAGAFPPGSANRPTAGSISTGVSASPTATLTPVPSPTQPTGWLQVAPTTAQLGCDGDQRTQYVVLRNTGSSKISWQVQFSLSRDQAGVSVNPQSGRLSADQSMSIQVQSTTLSDARQGVIQFVPMAQNAGSPASLAYTTAGCQGN